MNKEKYEKGYRQAYIDYDRLINNGYTKDDALFELETTLSMLRKIKKEAEE